MSRTLMLVLLSCACTPPPPSAESAENQPVPALAAAPKSSETATPASKTATPEPAKSARAVPPLSSPNATAKPAPVNAEDAGAPTGDPRRDALWRVGVIGQRCHEKNAPGVNGDFTLEMTLGSDGSIEKTRVIAARSTAALVGGAFERCLLDGVKKERFPAPRADDVVLEVPLAFKPGT